MSAGRGQARDALCDMIRRFVRGETAPGEFPSQALLAGAREHQVSYPLFTVFSSDDPILGPARERIEAGARGAADHARWLQENLGASVPFVWLKGGAGLAENDFAPMPGRYMADLDILVSKEDVARATEALAALGYVAADTGYHEALHPHLPIFAAAGRGEGLEVHTRLLRFGEGGVLLPENLLARAETVSTSAGEARIPCRVDRIVHLIAHAQIQSHRFSRRTFLARDAIELFRLVGNDDDSLGEAFQILGVGAFDDALGYLQRGDDVFRRVRLGHLRAG